MVGRELPNLRPKREDHRGAIGGNILRKTGRTIVPSGRMEGELSRSWEVTMILIHKALVWLWDTGFLVIRFNLQGRTWETGAAACEFDRGTATSRKTRRTRTRGLQKTIRRRIQTKKKCDG